MVNGQQIDKKQKRIHRLKDDFRMANLEKIKKNKPTRDGQKTDNPFLCIYINDFVKKFRNFNSDEFLIVITGVKKYSDKVEKRLTILLGQLKENNFTI